MPPLKTQRGLVTRRSRTSDPAHLPDLIHDGRLEGFRSATLSRRDDMVTRVLSRERIPRRCITRGFESSSFSCSIVESGIRSWFLHIGTDDVPLAYVFAGIVGGRPASPASSEARSSQSCTANQGVQREIKLSSLLKGKAPKRHRGGRVLAEQGRSIRSTRCSVPRPASS